MKINIIAMLLLAVTISGCKTSQKASKDSTPLCGVQWNLVSIEGQLIEEFGRVSQPCIIFYEDGNFSGNFGCNAFFGEYFKKKHKMEMERLMQKALKKEITQYEISGKTLILYEGKDEIMRFEDSGIRIDEAN